MYIYVRGQYPPTCCTAFQIATFAQKETI